MVERVSEGACQSDLTDPSLSLVPNTPRITSCLLVSSSHRNTGCARTRV